MKLSPPASHPTLFPNTDPKRYIDLNPSENPFHDPPILQHDQQAYSSDLVAASPAQNITTTTTNANSPTQSPPSSPFRPSPESSTLGEANPSHRTRQFMFAALIMAFYASTIILTAAIVLMVRNATGSTNGRLRAIGVIMGVTGGTGVLSSGLAAWKMWKNKRRRTRRKGSRTQEQMELELELRGLMTKNEPLAFSPNGRLKPALDLADVPLPLPLFDSRSKWGSRKSSDLGCIDRTTLALSASGDHDDIVRENIGAKNEMSISAFKQQEEEKRQDFNPDQGTTLSRSPSSTIFSRNIIAPNIPSTSNAQSQPRNNKLRSPAPHQDQTLRLAPTPPATTATAATTTTSDEQPQTSKTRTPHIPPSIFSSTSSSSLSLSLPIQNPSSQLQPQPQPQPQNLSLLHTLASEMGSDSESTRQTKRKRGLKAAKNWGAVDDDDDEGPKKGDGKGGKAREKGERTGDDEMESEIEIENGRWNANGVGNGNLDVKGNANGNGNGKRWGRVWSRKRREK